MSEQTAGQAVSERDRVLEALKRGIPEGVLKKHPHSGYDYIEAHHAIRTANEIFGADGWSSLVADGPKIISEFTKATDKGENRVAVVTCTVRVTARIGEMAVDHDGVGLSTADAPLPVFAGALDTAFKGAEHDALKRALIKFGDPFGLTLYEKDKSERNIERAAAAPPPAFAAPSQLPDGPEGWKAKLAAAKSKAQFGVIWNACLAAIPEANALLGAWAKPVYDALPERAAVPAERPKTSSFSFRVGRDKGVPVSDLSDASLEWYAGIFQKDLSDPDKAQFHANATKNLEAVRAEQAWRKAQAGKAAA